MINKNNILESSFITEIKSLASNMYRLGWDEKNSGNISALLTQEELEGYLDTTKHGKEISLGIQIPSLKNKYFIVTGSGKYFKNIEKNPEDGLCVIKVNETGDGVYLLWGLVNGGIPTSELSTHLQGHAARLMIDKNHKVVIHTHPTFINVMNLITEVDDKIFTNKLWKTATEAIVVFPEGVAVMPWMVCGTNEIGIETAKKLKDFRFVIWTAHGVFGTGTSFDDAFGLIETVEKIAMIYVHAGDKIINGLEKEDLRKLVERFNLTPREDFLE